MTGPSVELYGITKQFGDFTAVDGIDLSVEDGEFLTLLGPSGCGKTTTLRMIGGFEYPTYGQILIHGEDMSVRPPYKRPVNTVFQNYALFPHMTVGENVGYGLEMSGVPKDERQRRVDEALELIRLPNVRDRKPGALSGGQQQRVALARALINRPEVLLLDEPLGALDLKLRKAMQLELKQLNREVGITFIYVTHDQEEALTMSDRIAVMSEGHILQLGSPEEIYERPTTRFVADFIGQTNFIHGHVSRQEGVSTVVDVPGVGEMRVTSGDPPAPGLETVIAIRPEKVSFIEDLGSGGAPASWNQFAGRVEEIIYLGTHTQYILRLGSGDLVAVHHQNRAYGAPDHQIGDDVGAAFDPESASLLTS